MSSTCAFRDFGIAPTLLDYKRVLILFLYSSERLNLVVGMHPQRAIYVSVCSSVMITEYYTSENDAK
jgi:hypothetical protein